MEEVIISYQVREYLKDLTTVLYKKEYFGFVQSAEAYVNNLVDKILEISTTTQHQTPQALKRYGNYYIKIRGSQRTTWYVFFDKKDNRYFVGFITNNHMPQSEYLNEL